MSGGGNNVLASLVKVLLPKGGLVAAIHHVYLDESGTHDGSPVMTMAGYLFAHVQAARFDRDWERDLDGMGLEYAHMADCTCGSGPYEHMDEPARVQSEIKLIQHIKRRTVFGFGVSVIPRKYEAIVGSEPTTPTAYTFCLMACVTFVRAWIERNQYQGDVAYFFESGHRHAAEAHAHMEDIAKGGDDVRRRYGYVSHVFADKRKVRPLQAADMLAWQYQHYIRRSITDGVREPRKDFTALLRPHDVCMDYVEANLEEFRKAFAEGRVRLPGEPR